jgi:cytochrome c biogenesis protein CcmG/thiol:disulfide interchange protein DsbE
MLRKSLLFAFVLVVLAGMPDRPHCSLAAKRALDLPDGSVVHAAGQEDSLLVGKPAPAFTLSDLNGKRISLADYKGKAVLINFWATWCGPCKIETPWLVELQNQYAAKGFIVLGVSADDLDGGDAVKMATERQQIARVAQQMHIPYPVLVGGGALSDLYGNLDSLPASFFVNRQGVIVATEYGLVSKSDIEANVRKALGE